ncbi:uncharacterized protein BDW70DRAFT_145324 [Aspergillus foveolatus]|uniref:uncharacterized protein n=1 Tax=Aspergillus foveolatus TaxID=210207 RepID=UPI003CCDD64B
MNHPEERLEVSNDWPSVPADFSETVQLRVEWDPSPLYLDLIHVHIRNTRVPDHFIGFPESGSFVSIEAPHFQRSSSDVSGHEIAFKHIPYLGSRSRSGSIALRHYTLSRSSLGIANPPLQSTVSTSSTRNRPSKQQST